MTLEFYKNEDLFPENYEMILDSKNYLGCYIAKTANGDNFASV